MRKGASIEFAARTSFEELADNLLLGIGLSSNSIFVMFEGTGITLIRKQS
jgi:hypothetical protein